MLFTIIMPVYNVLDWLEPSVSSVLSMHGDDYHVILVDDGSTDGSSALCDTIASRDGRVSVIHKVNGGLASARNAGIEAAQGEYILMFDSDDFVEADTLDALRPIIHDYHPDMIHFDLMKKYKDHEDAWHSKVPEGFLQGEQLRSDLLKRVLKSPGDYLLSACIHAYRRDRLNQAGLRFISEREVLSEDFLFNLQAMMVLDSLYVLQRCLYHYNSREGSLTLNHHKPRQFERFTCLYHHLMESARQNGTDEQTKALIRTYYAYNLFFRAYCYHEYGVWEGHTWQDAIEHVTHSLQNHDLQQAMRKADFKHLPTRERLNILFIRLKFEPGIRFAFRKHK